MKTPLKLSLCTCLLVLGAVTSHASNNASDNAGNYVATGSFGAGTAANLGTGFGAWSFATTGAGGSYLGETSSATGLPETDTWGLYAGGDAGNTSSADRQFTGGALVAGQTFSIDMGNSASIDNPGDVGVNLLSGATPVFTIKFAGGQSDWQINDGGSDFNTTIPYAANTIINFSFTYNGGNSYSVAMTEGATTYNANNFTATNSLTDITGDRLFSTTQGPGQNVGFNNMEIIPEPSTYAMILGGFGMLIMFRRMRRGSKLSA